MLEVDSLSKRFDKKNALDQVTFRIGAGEVVGLLGPNGAGKSTCIKCIAGLLRADHGTIHLDGLPHKHPEARQKMAYVPETPDPYPLLTVWEHLQFTAQLFSVSNWKPYAEQLMERFEMTPNKDKLGRELSKGMRQKVSMMCGLVSQPQFLMFDEPMIGLDPKAIRETRQLFKELKQEGKSLLVSTHLIDSVETIADRILILQNGILIKDDTPNNLKTLLGSGNLEESFFNLTGNEGA
jgi:ABC-type multidrug transport system ATPase subunit